MAASSSPTPTGLRPKAQGCGTPLPWDWRRRVHQPQRGCVPKPRVAVLRYPGIGGVEFTNPNGVASQSPGLRYSATLGMAAPSSPTPTGLRPKAQGCGTPLPCKWRPPVHQPQRGCVPKPRVAVLRYPWNGGPELTNPEGVASQSPGLRYSATLGMA